MLPIFLLTLMLLTMDVADYALQNDSANALDLMARFIQRGDRYLTWVGRL
jgi:hypothetical protein